MQGESGGSLSKHNGGWWGGYWWLLAGATVCMALMGGMLSEVPEPGLARINGASPAAVVSARTTVAAPVTVAGLRMMRIQDIAAK